MISRPALTIFGLTGVVSQIPGRNVSESEGGQSVVLFDDVAGVRSQPLALEEPSDLKRERAWQREYYCTCRPHYIPHSFTSPPLYCCTYYTHCIAYVRCMYWALLSDFLQSSQSERGNADYSYMTMIGGERKKERMAWNGWIKGHPFTPSPWLTVVLFPPHRSPDRTVLHSQEQSLHKLRINDDRSNAMHWRIFIDWPTESEWGRERETIGHLWLKVAVDRGQACSKHRSIERMAFLSSIPFHKQQQRKPAFSFFARQKANARNQSELTARYRRKRSQP